MNQSLPTETLFTSPKELPTETDHLDEKALLSNCAARKLLFDQGEDLLRKLTLPQHLHQESQQSSNRSPPANDILSSNRGGDDEINELFPIKNQRQDSGNMRQNYNPNKHEINIDKVLDHIEKPKNRNNSISSYKNKEKDSKNRNSLQNQSENQVLDDIPPNSIKFMDNAQCSLEKYVLPQTPASPINKHVQFDSQAQSSIREVQLHILTEGNLESNSQKKIIANRTALRSASQIVQIKSSRLLNKKLTEQQQQQLQQEQQELQQQKESAFALWGWINLKKRIDALKYLMRNIEMSGMIQIISKLKDAHMNILADAGSDYVKDSNNWRNKQEELVNQKSILSKITFIFLSIFKIFPTIPNNLLIIAIFKIMLSVQLLYQIFQLPLMLSFPENTINIFKSNHPILRIWFVLPFILEILLNFNLPFYEHGERITSKFRIISNYLQKDFLWDLAGVFGSGFIFQDANFVFILGIFVLRFVKFKHMYDAIEEKFQLSLRFSVAHTLVNLFLSMTLVAHICGCIFQWIAVELSQEGVTTWLQANHLQHSSISDRYIASLYFAFITMISVGYGDIVPISNLERIFVIIMTIFSCGVFAYVVSSISELFEISFQQESVYKQQKYEISNYMETRNINSELQTKVFQFLEMLRTKKKQEPESGQGILDIMNPKLRQSIYQSYYGGHLLAWKLFSNNFSQNFLEMLSVSCKEQVYGPGEIVFYQQESDQDFSEQGIAKFSPQNQSVYLIIKGEVQVYQENLKPLTNNNNMNVSNYKTIYATGECFGVKEFFCGQPYEFTAQSKGLTTVMKIQREFFLEVIKNFPKDYESFSFLRDELLFNKPDKYTKCQPCNRYDHSLYKCPRMHFLKRKLTTIYRFLHSEPQERKTFSRTRDSKFHAIGEEHKHVRKQLKIFRVKLVRHLKQEEQKEISHQLNAFKNNLSSSGGKEKFDILNSSQSKCLDKIQPRMPSSIDYVRMSGSSSLAIKNKLGKIGESTTSIKQLGSVKHPSIQKNIQSKKKGKEPCVSPDNKNNKLDEINGGNKFGKFGNRLQIKNESINEENDQKENKESFKQKLNESENPKDLKSEIDIEIEEGDESNIKNMNTNKNNNEEKISSSENSSDDENNSNSIDLSGNSGNKFRMNSQETYDLMEIIKEEQDEMFFFKCPILFWSASKKAYILSSIEDDLEGNQAIQQYLETNFEMYLDSQGEFALPLEDCTEDNIIENHTPNYHQSQSKLDLETQSPLSPSLQMRPRAIAQNVITKKEQMPSVQEAIIEEDFIKISANSLSYFNENKDNPFNTNNEYPNIIDINQNEKSDNTEEDQYQSNNAKTIFNYISNSPKNIKTNDLQNQGQDCLLDENEPIIRRRFSSEGLESEVLSEEYKNEITNDPFLQQQIQMNNTLPKPVNINHMEKKNYGFALDFSKLKQLPPVNVIADTETKIQMEQVISPPAGLKKTIKLEDIFRPSSSGTKQYLKLEQSGVLSADPSSDTPRFRLYSNRSPSNQCLDNQSDELKNEQIVRNGENNSNKLEDNRQKRPSLLINQPLFGRGQGSKGMGRFEKLQTLLSISQEFTSHIISNHQLLKQQQNKDKEQTLKQQQHQQVQQQQQMIQQLHQQQHLQQQLLSHQSIVQGSSINSSVQTPLSPNKIKHIGHRYSSPSSQMPQHQIIYPQQLNLSPNPHNNHNHLQSHNQNIPSNKANNSGQNFINNVIMSLNKQSSNQAIQSDHHLHSLIQKQIYSHTNPQQLPQNNRFPSAAGFGNNTNLNSNIPTISDFIANQNNQTNLNLWQHERSGSIIPLSTPSQADYSYFSHNIPMQVGTSLNAPMSQSSSLLIHQPVLSVQQSNKVYTSPKQYSKLKLNIVTPTPKSMTSMKQFHSELILSDQEGQEHRPAVPPTTQINIKPKITTDNQILLSNNFNNYNNFPEDIINEMLNFIFAFERAANFTQYYPKQNISTVIKKYIKYNEQRQIALMNKEMQQKTGRNNPRANLFRKRKTDKL